MITVISSALVLQDKFSGQFFVCDVPHEGICDGVFCLGAQADFIRMFLYCSSPYTP